MMTVDGSSAARVQTAGRGRRTGRHLKSGRRGTFGPGSFSVPESPNRRVEEASGTAYAALTPYIVAATPYNPPASCNSSNTASVLRPLETDRSPWRYLRRELGEAELAAHASLGEAELAAHVEKSRGTHGREGTSLSLASRGGLGAVKGALPLRQREQRVRHWRQETIE